MTRLHRTHLTTSQRREFAARVVSVQEQGSLSALSRDFAVSRPTAYAAQSAARKVLDEHFCATSQVRHTLSVDEAQLRRAVVMLRVASPTSIRAIESLVPVLYPGVKLSYGKIQSWLVEAEQQAQAFNESVPLDGISAVALDEMFSQGAPVLAGVDLDSGFLLGLRLSERRDGASWAAYLREHQAQGLSLQVVVKDAARGISAGVKEVFPQAEQRDDCFHALYAMNKVRRRLEQAAYKAISAEYEADAVYSKISCEERLKRDKAHRQWVWLRRESRRIVERLDRYEAAMHQVREAMEVVSLSDGQFIGPDTVAARIETAADDMAALDSRAAKSVARYLRGRAPGLALALSALQPQLDALPYERHDCALGCVIWRLIKRLNKSPTSAQRYTDRRHLVGVYAQLIERLGQTQADALLTTLRTMLSGHHRASSAIEGFNAALRPHLYLHKGVTPGFLALFQAYFNLHVRRWGRHKGTSAYEVLRTQRVEDWLTLIGFPPSPQVH